MDASEGSAAAVLRTLLDEVETRRLPSGTLLVESEIAERLGVGRPRVRYAIQQLVDMRLAVRGGRSGTVIATLSPDQFYSVFAYREGLEGMAARMAASHASDGELLVIKETVLGAREIDDAESLHLRNLRFHSLIVLAARNRYLADLIRSVRLHMSLIHVSAYSRRDRAASAQAEHEDLLEALIARDAQRAEAAARHHVRMAFRERLVLMASR